jgi:heat shock protein HtpX
MGLPVISDVNSVQQICPKCQASIPIDARYPTWCDKCDWNLEPPAAVRTRNVFETLYAQAGLRSSRNLFDAVSKDRFLRPTIHLSTVLAFVIATLVHGIALGFAILGVWIIINSWPNVWLGLIGALCLAIAWFFRPRFAKLNGEVLPREQYPTLYRLADRVADALNSPKVDSIVIGSWFNASFSRVGVRQKRIVYLGLPLWSILDPQERVALLGHELAHGVNGDPIRGFFVGTAIDSLVTWHRYLTPSRLNTVGGRFIRRAGLEDVFAAILLWPLSALAWLAAYALSHLLWRASQRAEYLADYLSTTVSSTRAAVMMLDKLHFGSTFPFTVNVLLGEARGSFLADYRRRTAATPARELERMKRIGRLASARLDATHPPTAYRMEFLAARPIVEAKVTLAAAESDQIDRELAGLHTLVERELRERYYGRIFAR